jgi:hypothetical protein
MNRTQGSRISLVEQRGECAVDFSSMLAQTELYGGY